MRDQTPVPDVGVELPYAVQAVAEEMPALRTLAVDLAVAAGELVRVGRTAALDEVDSVQTKSSRTDVVTVMDRRCEEFLRTRLSQLRPGDAVLGEEAGVRGDPGRITWVVDPIDGTVNYLYGLPEYAVSIAAVVGDPTVSGAWHPVAGAVVNPVTGEVYHAHAGGGASVRRGGVEAPLQASTADEVGMVLLATGFGYDAHVRLEQALALVEILPAVRDIRRGGSAALDLCKVAEGLVDAYAERGVNSWDVAAGWVIAAEAGARVGTWGSGSDRPRGILAGPRALWEDLSRLVTEAYQRASRVGPGDPEATDISGTRRPPTPGGRDSR